VVDFPRRVFDGFRRFDVVDDRDDQRQDPRVRVRLHEQFDGAAQQNVRRHNQSDDVVLQHESVR